MGLYITNFDRTFVLGSVLWSHYREYERDGSLVVCSVPRVPNTTAWSRVASPYSSYCGMKCVGAYSEESTNVNFVRE